MSPDKPRARAKYCKDNKDCGSLTVKEIVGNKSRAIVFQGKIREFYFESGKLAFLTKSKDNLII